MKNGFAPKTLRTNRKRTNKSMSEHKKQETMLILYADMRVCASEKIGSTCGDNDNEQCSPKIEYCGYRMRNGTVYGDDEDGGGEGVSSCCCFWC